MRKQFKKLTIKMWVIDTISQKLQCEIAQSRIHHVVRNINPLTLHISAGMAIPLMYLNPYEKLPSLCLQSFRILKSRWTTAELYHSIERGVVVSLIFISISVPLMGLPASLLQDEGEVLQN